MDHWHAESLLIRIISIFQQACAFFFRSYVGRRQRSGPPSCQSSRRLRPPRSLLLTSLRFHLGQRAGLHTSSPPPFTLQQQSKAGRKGDVPTRSSSSPRDFTLCYVCMLSSPRRVSYVRPSFVLPSFLPTMFSEGVFIELAARSTSCAARARGG